MHSPELIADARPEQVVDTIIIGAGQTGLAAAYYLRQHRVSFVVLDERPAVGHVWDARYDSLRLFSPAWASSLPGLPWSGNRRRYPTKAETADYFRQYARHFELPIETGQRVTHLRRTPEGYALHTAAGARYQARHVIICTGPYAVPRVPDFAHQLPAAVVQLPSGEYRNPGQLPGTGPVVVAGSGNSALQIAADLAAAGRPVFVAFDEKTPASPNNTAMWLLLLGGGILQAGRESRLGRFMRSQPEPVVRADLQRLRQFSNVRFIGRALGLTPGGGIRGQLAETPAPEAVIWATGFAADYRWIMIPEAFGPTGEPLHQRGLSPVPGLAFLGLPWLHSRRSALIGGAAADARHVVEQLQPAQGVST